MSVEIIATLCFALAILHTFSIKQFQKQALRFPEGSPGENFFHLLGEVEVVFGIWAGIFISYLLFSQGHSEAIQYLESRNFTEPTFVFVIMAVCSTKPILELAEKGISAVSHLLPLRKPTAFYWSTLVAGPLLGSLITEPAAMTVTALILFRHYYQKNISQKFMYATLGLLFVNISIGGTLTPFAAPPVLMVAKTWNWDLNFMLLHFGWKAALAVILSTSIVTWRFKEDLAKLAGTSSSSRTPLPLWVSLIHVIFLFLIVASSHHMPVFIGLFLFFLGLVKVTQEYQDELKIKEGLLVAFFLGGLVVIGGLQQWWLEPLLTRLGTLPLYLGAIGLTAITDNAALTYLGSQVPSLSKASQYALVAGSVVGGGLTVIANAPNPVGFGILQSCFGPEGISPLRLLVNAFIPTLIAAICFFPF